MVVNGDLFNIDTLNDNSLYSLLKHYSLDPGRVAIEINGKIIKSDNYFSTILDDTDKVEIIHFVGGG